MRRIQYDAYVSGTSNAQAQERVSLDKFHPHTETPESNWKAAAMYSVAALAPFLFFVNLFPQTTPVLSRQDVQIQHQTTVQYQRYTAPVLPPPEVVTVDKWHPRTEVPPNAVKNQTYTYPSSWLELTPAQRPEKVSADRTPPVYPPFVPDVARQQYTYPSLSFANVFPTTVPVLSSETVVIHIPRTTQYQQLAFTQAPGEVITADKWQPSIAAPPRDVSRAQYLYPSLSFTNVFPTTVPVLSAETTILDVPRTTQYQQQAFIPFFGEVVRADKWTSGTPPPPRDMARTQYLYPSWSMDERALTQKERTTPDRWLGSRPDKVFDLTRQQYLYPSESFVFRPEIVTVDKWIPQLQPVPADVSRTQYLYPSLALTDVFPATVPVLSMESVIIPIPKTTQYQRLAEIPFFGETILVDKWTPSTPPVPADVVRLQYLYPSEFFVSLYPTAIPVLSSQDVAVQYTPVVQYQRLTLIPFFGAFQSPDKWLPSTPPVPRNLARTQYLYPSWTMDEKALTQPERVSFDKWAPATNVPLFDVRRQQYLYPYFTNDPNSLTLGPNVPLDRWIGHHPDRIFDVARNQYLYPSEFFVSVFPSTVAVFSPSSVQVQYQATFQYQRLAQTIVPAARVTVDMWHPRANAPWLDLPRTQYLYPSVFYVEVPTSTAIYPMAQSIISYPLRFQYQGRAQPTFVPATPLTWLGSHPDRIFDLARTQYLYPSFTIDPRALGQVFFDRWAPPTNQPVMTLARNQYLYPSLFMDPAAEGQVEPVTFSRWNFLQSLPVRDVARLQYLYPSFAIDPKHLLDRERITSDKWTGQYPAFIFDVLREQFTYPPFIQPSEIVIFHVLPPPFGGHTHSHRPQPPSGSATPELASPLAGASASLRAAPTGGATAPTTTSPTGGKTTTNLGTPTGGKTSYDRPV